MPINYQEGKIYKIYNTINDDIYVGSTTLKLCERMRDQRNCVNNKIKKDRLLYKAFREHGVDNFHIELIEKCPCNDRDELRRTEGVFIRSLKPSLNCVVAGRTDKEYYNDNKEWILRKRQEFYNNNKDTFSQRHKEYREQHKELIREQKQQSYENYRKTIVLQKVECECGCIVTRGCLIRHRKSKKHIELMKDKLN